VKAIVITLLLAGCSSSSAQDDSKQPTTPVVIAPPAAGTDAAVFVRTHTEGNLLVAELVTRATPDLSGAALRVAFPVWLHFDHRDDASGWTAESVHHTKIATDHSVVLVDTRKGTGVAHAAPAAGADAVLTTLYFTQDPLPAGDLGALTIVPLRSELRDARGKPVAVRYYDQTFTR
jgi:hypothetical protein